MKILVIDDELAIREAYRHVLCGLTPPPITNPVQALAEELFGAPLPASPDTSFKVDFAAQGLDAVAMVQAAVEADSRYRLAFIDVRMPPGIDGRETARRIRAIDRDINLVIVTGYSDHSTTDLAASAGPPDKLFYLSKPFSIDEVRQMAVALCHRWGHDTNQLAQLREKIAELATSEARAKHAALHDFLTGAPNRMAFQQRLAQRTAHDGGGYALALLDLDRFKHVNDTFGHGAGDDLLVAVYKLLRANLPDSAFAARLGGDEFGLILDAAVPGEAEALCNKLVDLCSGSFSIFGNSVRIGASCGLFMPRSENRDAAEMLRRTDLALFAAKRAGRGQVCLFNDAMDASRRFRQAIETGLRNAIAANELTLLYQPIVERETLETVGFEALLRWTSPEHGIVSPAVFIPIAEESSLIHELGEWVLNRALADSSGWPDQFVSINFSPCQFKRANFLEWLDAAVTASGCTRSQVQIEITETAIFDDTDRAATVIEQLQGHGYRIALDDFGTGYSSLFNIKNFSLNCIKIDRSFIEGLGQDRHSAAIVSSIVHLSRALRLSIVAEGVETESQCQMLRLTGCTHLQGFLFSKALSAADALERVRIERGGTCRPALSRPDRIASRT